MQRHVYANRSRQIARPHAATDHDIVRIDIPVRCADTGYFDAVVTNLCNDRVLMDLYATTARTFRERLRDIDTIGVTVRWNVYTTYKVVCTYERVKFGNLLNRNDIDLQVEHFGH